MVYYLNKSYCSANAKIAFSVRAAIKASENSKVSIFNLTFTIIINNTYSSYIYMKNKAHLKYLY